MHNVVVVINGGKKVIPRKLLDELANAAGAETWECLELPEQSAAQHGVQPTLPVADDHPVA